MYLESVLHKEFILGTIRRPLLNSFERLASGVLAAKSEAILTRQLMSEATQLTAVLTNNSLAGEIGIYRPAALGQLDSRLRTRIGILSLTQVGEYDGESRIYEIEFLQGKRNPSTYVVRRIDPLQTNDQGRVIINTSNGKLNWDQVYRNATCDRLLVETAINVLPDMMLLDENKSARINIGLSATQYSVGVDRGIFPWQKVYLSDTLQEV